LRVDGQTNYCCGFVLQVRNVFYFHPKKTDAHDSKNNQKKRLPTNDDDNDDVIVVIMLIPCPMPTAERTKCNLFIDFRQI